MMERSDDADNTAINILLHSLTNNFKITSNDDDDCEIVNQFVEDNQKYFSIKKKDGWLPKVRFDEVSKELIYAFYAKIAQESFIDVNMKKSFLLKKAAEQSTDELNRMLRKFQTPRGLKLPFSKKKQIEEMLSQLRKCNIEDTNYELRLSELSEHLCIENILKMRENQLLSLKKRIYYWNKISDNKLPMKVVNDYDLEILPEIKYVNTSELAADCNIDPNSEAEGCNCDILCSFPECICLSKNSTVPPYDNGRLSEAFLKTKGKNQNCFTSPIYECNEYCACPRTCSNKVIRNGSDVKFVLFRTFNNCGWGVRTAHDLEPGTFIILYAGEIVAIKEACNRDFKYSFGLVYYDDGREIKNCDFLIDAKYVGNIGRFFNHSCQPNLGIASVFTKYRKPSLYEVSFFATQHIRAGDHLTINYGDEYGLKCGCNQKHCRHGGVR